MDFAFGVDGKKKQKGPSKNWTPKQIKDELAKLDAKI